MRTTKEWETYIIEWKASGKTQTIWCEEKGINLHTFRDRLKI